MSRNYYYLVAGLPDLALDMKKHPMPWAQFMELANEQLVPADLYLIRCIFLRHDNQNILNALLKTGKPFIEGGNYSADEIEEKIKQQSFRESYLNKLVQAYREETPPNTSLSWEDNLIELYFNFMQNLPNSFIREWYRFNFLLQNIRVAITVRKQKLNPSQFILGNDELSQQLKKSTLRDFGLGDEYPIIEKIISILETDNLLEQEFDLDQLRWRYIDELNTHNYFSTEVVLGFVLKYEIMDRWLKLDPAVGQKLFEELIARLKNSYEFPKEFAINERR